MILIGKRHPYGCLFSAVVLVLVAVLVSILVLVVILIIVLVLIVVLVLILVVHLGFLHFYFSRVFRYPSLPMFSRFILGLEYNSCQ